MSEQLRVLVVEDNVADVDLLREMLPATGPESFEIRSVARLSEALTHVIKGGIDIILLDLGLPDSQGLETYRKMYQAAPLIPIVIFTGNDDPETAVIAVKDGTQDYLIKGQIDGRLLIRSIRYAMERKRSEEELKESERKLKAIFEALPIGISILNTKHKIVSVNPALEKILDLSKKSLLSGDYAGRTYIKSTGERMLSEEFASVRAISGDATVQNVETGVVKEDGSLIWTSVSAVPVNISDWKAVIVTSDITERKQAQARLLLAHDVLAILNCREGAKEIIRDILHLVKGSIGIEAAGIRLRAGDDFPYFQINGFPDHFVELERSLCVRDEAARIMRDSEGNVILECMCGNVIRGRTDPKQPFFTPGGSFWSNGTTDLLASTTEEGRQARTRNRCNGEGYESVALIPLRSNGDIIGLLQLNDHRRNRFTLEMIQFFEGLGASIGIALSRKRAEEAWRQAEENFRQSLEESPMGIRIVSAKGETFFANRAILDLYGFDGIEELKTTSVKERYTPKSYAEYQERKKKRTRGEEYPSEYQIDIIRKTGEVRSLQVSRKAVLWDSQQQDQVIYRDITAQKKAEARIRETVESLRKALGGIIQVLSSASETRDPYTAGHQKRMADLARAIAQELALPPDRVEGIRVAGTIHDIGKMGIPAEILSKPTWLSKNEYSLIQAHAQIGHDILGDIELGWPIGQIILQHHERMDGSGYPQGLKGEDILFESRILAVADVIEAMASHRPYRPALGIDAAILEIEKGKGVLYDPSVVEACLRLFREKRYTLNE